MNLRGKISVEPLAEARLVKIERAVVAGYAEAMARPRRAPARWWGPALAGAAIGAAVASLALWRVARTETTPRAAAPSASPVRVATATTGSRVDLGDATIEVAADTAFTVTRPGCDAAWSAAVTTCPAGASGVLIALDGGAVELAVESRKGRAPLVVRAGDVDVVVVGTRFSVTRGADIAVQVTEGVVRVAREGREVRVAAGETWSAPAHVVAGAAMPAPTPTAAGGGAAGSIAAPALAVAGDAGGPDLHDHTAVVPNAPDRAAGRDRSGDHAGDRRGERDAASAGSAARGADGAGVVDLITLIRRERVAPPRDVGVTGDDALAIYNQLIGGAAEERLDGYYGAAHVLHAQGKDREALRWLDAYNTQASKGPAIESVLWLRIQILCRHPIDQKCRAAASTYEARFVGSTRAELASKLRLSME